MISTVRWIFLSLRHLSGGRCKNMDRNILCSKTATIREALEKINLNVKGTVFIVDENDKLCGIATDGDIRRGLLSGLTLDSGITGVSRKEFVYAHQGESIKEIFEKFNEDIRILPIVDQDCRVVDFSEYKSNMRLPIAQPQLNGKEMEYLLDAFLSTWISSTGRYVTEFESSFARWCGMPCGVAVSNGTTALHLALTALGVGEGDEVIVPDITFAATINAVLYTGATPVIVDVEEDGWCISPDEIEKAVTERTKAVIPVHIYGQPCDMERIMEIAGKYGLYVVEDCAEAHGARYDGRKVGSFGDISCFSFFGNKIITTGEGGMCLTRNKELEEKLRLYRDHGMSKTRKYYHEVIGYNYRMTNLQAAIGVAQLENIDQTLAWRSNLEESYRKKIAGIDGIEMQRNDLRKREKVTWLVTVCVEKEKRDACMNAMTEMNIDARPFFIPLSEMEIYRKYTFSNRVSTELAERGFNLPTSYMINEEEVDRVVRALRQVV